MHALQKLKALKPTSNVVGSEGRELWISKQKTPEERNKIKAIVSTRDYVERYAAATTNASTVQPELDWRGRVYLGHLNVLFHVEQTEPVPEDYHHVDAKSNYTGWFGGMQQALDIPTAQLQDVWLKYMQPHSLGSEEQRRQVHSMMSWNLRGKSLLALQNAWDVLDAQGVDFLFLQELGGEGEACAPWDKITLNLGRQEFTAFVGNPPAGFRSPGCLS